MRKFIEMMVIAAGLALCLGGAARADNVDWRAQRKQLNVEQKRDRNALKMQQRNIERSWKNGHVSAAQRAGTKHEMQRASRDMKLRQKDARQDLKDRQRSVKEMQRAYNQ